MSKTDTRLALRACFAFGISDFGFVSDFEIRISDLLAPAVESKFAAGKGHFAVQDAFGGEQLVAEMAHLMRRATQDRHLQTVALAQMHVQA